MSSPPQFKAPSTEELQELLPAYDVLSFICLLYTSDAADE